MFHIRTVVSYMEHNPYLVPRQAASGEAAKGSIEKLDAIQNIVWQTRAADPTDYENRLGDQLEQAFAAGIADLAPLVAKLNELGGRAPDGAQWSEASFQAYMKGAGK
jgi:hypothetical protein